MQQSWNKGKGKAAQWLRDHVGHEGADCLIWPFSRQPTGYGALGFMGKLIYAHRFMCELVHGPCPGGMECAHSCGNGHLGCVHPKHVEWKTKSENKKDQTRHGTNKGSRWGNRGAFTDDQVRDIRAMNEKFPFRETAKQYGVSQDTIRWIKTGRYYKRVS